MGRKHNNGSRPQVSKRQRYLAQRLDPGIMVRFNAQRDRDREVWR